MLVRRWSWLLIETPARAAGFLTAVAILAALLLRLELGQSWNLYAAGTQVTKAGDDYQLLLQNVGSAFQETGGELVVLLGGSTIRELTADDALLSKQLTAWCERDVQFVNLGSSSQSFSESWDIAALVPENRKRLFIVGINPNRLGFDDDSVMTELSHRPSGIPVSFSLLWNVALHTGHVGSSERIISAIARQERLGAKWRLRDVFVAPQPVARKPSEDSLQPDRASYREPVWTHAEKLRQANAYIATRVTDFRNRYRAGVQWYNRFHDRFKGPNSDVKFVVPPTDKTFDKVNELISTDFLNAIRLLGGESRTIDLRNRVRDLDTKDFFDTQHLVAKGREKLHPVFFDAVTRALGCPLRASQ
ncbi:hypothetical protein [Bradyrhizobium sp.]|uniref:hypothetical protein n=1 Tax=Bradyrhizobium sp. TaxID=376 RepID=UPI002735E554|nr:hypothetical protein [Bradyrhizobium sp.]MDP3693547.1 hypothetical protein [Bradyrhizobium sp.]